MLRRLQTQADLQEEATWWVETAGFEDANQSVLPAVLPFTEMEGAWL